MRRFHSETKKPSVLIAKDRLKALLASDRTACTPDTYERLCDDLFRSVSKYKSITRDFFNVEVTRSKICITLTGEEL